jgi:hypothetical protein
LNNLRYLSLSDNWIDEIPEHIENLKSLVTLSLANNLISGNIDKSLCMLYKLSSLDLSGNYWMNGDIPLEFSKLKNLTSLDLPGSELYPALEQVISNLYTTSPALEQFISKLDPNWVNSPPEIIERNDLCIHYITTTSDYLGYSLHANIPILIIMTQPVSLTGGHLVINLETGKTDQEIHIPPFSQSYTATAIYTVQEGDFSEDLNVNSIRLTNGASLTNEFGEAVDLRLIPEINLAAMKNIYVDGTIPIIEINEPNDPCVEQLYKIKGTATDISKDFSVLLTIVDQYNNHVFNETSHFFKNETENWEFDLPQSIWQVNSSYTIQVDVKDFAGNTNTLSRSVTIGKRPSIITTHLSNNTIIFGQTALITGNISPPESLIGEEVTLKLISPIGKEPGRKINADEDGSFEYALQCNDIDQAGIWQIVAFWDGTSCLDPAISESQMLTVEKASCNVALDATHLSVKLGDQVSITGQVMPEYYCEGHMTNIPVDLMISSPKGIHEIELQTMNTFGHFAHTNFAGFDLLGEWQIVASVKNNAYASSFSDMIPINVVETAGYAIIVQGKIAAEEGLESHNKTANDVYHHFKQRGLLDEDILYFNYDTDQASYKITDQILDQLANENVPNNIIDMLKELKNIAFINEESFVNRLKKMDAQVLQYQSQILALCCQPIEIDGLPTKTAIQKAITEDMPDIMKNQPANLYIVMVDHGNEDTFYIDPETISDDELNQWLSKLENTPGWDQEIIMMLGFCFSGSFIDKLSNPNRIIITSAGPDEFSYKGPLDQDNIREGEFFISEFFKSVALGKTIKHAFSEAVIQTEIYTAKGENSVNAPPYFDNSAQHPLLDDNGDGLGSNNILETSADGDLAERITIGVSSLTMNDPGDVFITEVSEAIFLGTDETTTDQLWAKVSDSLRLLTLWIEIKRPDFVPNAVGTGQVEMDLPKIVTITYDAMAKSYQWNSADLANIFDIPGTYHIYYFAKDTNSKNVSPMKESIVYKASRVNHPPEPFDLLYPRDDIEITSLGVLASFSADPTADAYTIMSWEDTTDPDHDRLSYTLFFKKDNDHFNEAENRIKMADLPHNFYEINLPNDWNGATVYWKVQAIDSYGAIRESGINRFHINNTNNPSNGTLWGYVYDATTNAPIEIATVLVSAGGQLVKRFTTMMNGKYFRALRPLSNYSIEVQKKGYVSLVKTPVHVPKDEQCQEDFFLVPDHSDVPKLSEIEFQTINEGETFAPITLDTYVTDGNNETHEIKWTATGNTDLEVSIDNDRIAIISPVDENWYGVEEVIFHAEDPDGNKATASVIFTIKPVNDPPIVLDIPDQTIFDYSRFQPIILDQYVVDVDNTTDEISWASMGSKSLIVSITNKIAFITLSDISWIGYENITFTASDPSGLIGVKTATFTVEKSRFVYDLNQNGRIDLDDLMMVLQIFSGIQPDKALAIDKQLGYEDLLFIMQSVSNR